MRAAAWIALLAGWLATAAVATAENRPAVVVTPGSARTFRAAVQTFADQSLVSQAARVESFRDAIGSALDYSNVFRMVSHEAFLGPTATLSLDDGPPLVCSDWTQIGADALVEGVLVVDEAELSVEFRVWDTARCTRLMRKRYRQSAGAEPKTMARRIADDIVGSFIGLRGVAGTEIAFVSNRSGNPEIYVMDADGSSARPATANGSINNFPSWSPDGAAILYTSYRHENRPLLFLSTRGEARPGRLLRRIRGEQAEYRGVFAPNGKRLAVVLSNNGGAADLYSVRPDGKRLEQLTHSRAIDISPAWSPDGSRLAFVSDRSGSPQIYLMDADGGEARRLTFQGVYNTAPAWSPDGRWIAYESRVGGQFDIWLIDPEGSMNLPLIVHPRSDESPSWSPNSRKLAFSSRRRGRADIYVVDVSGDNLRRLTRGAGDNTSPSWGPMPR